MSLYTYHTSYNNGLIIMRNIILYFFLLILGWKQMNWIVICQTSLYERAVRICYIQIKTKIVENSYYVHFIIRKKNLRSSQKACIKINTCLWKNACLKETDKHTQIVSISSHSLPQSVWCAESVCGCVCLFV